MSRVIPNFARGHHSDRSAGSHAALRYGPFKRRLEPSICRLALRLEKVIGQLMRADFDDVRRPVQHPATLQLYELRKQQDQ